MKPCPFCGVVVPPILPANHLPDCYFALQARRFNGPDMPTLEDLRSAWERRIPTSDAVAAPVHGRVGCEPKPFLYAVADNEGKAVMDEICCRESPEELEEYFRDQIEDLNVKVVPVYTGPQIETMREQLAQAVAMIETTQAHEAAARKGHEDLMAAIARSAFDLSLCKCCGKLVICLPDGMSNVCEPCAEREASNSFIEPPTAAPTEFAQPRDEQGSDGDQRPDAEGE